MLPFNMWLTATVSNVRNADNSIRARIHFTERPENAYLQKLLDGVTATAVTWEIHGLEPYATFELQVR